MAKSARTPIIDQEDVRDSSDILYSIDLFSGLVLGSYVDESSVDRTRRKYKTTRVGSSTREVDQDPPVIHIPLSLN